jgi:hypothetical protein
MVVIYIKIGGKLIDDVLLDGGFKVNIITKKLKTILGLPKPQSTTYNLWMAH